MRSLATGLSALLAAHAAGCGQILGFYEDYELGACGDGIVQPRFEACDDGGTSNADACSSICQVQEVIEVSAGFSHSCAILSGGKAKCWGYNAFGQLGLGDQSDRGNRPNQMGKNLAAINLGGGETVAAIAAGYVHTCALLGDGSVKCWGHNDYGQLGLGDTSWRGHSPETMGDNLPAVDLGAGETASAIAAGSRHTCALLSSGGVKCWGFNNFGQLGLGDTISRGDGAGEMGDDLPVVDLGEPAVALSLGTYHSCALLIGGGVKCWGNNDFGQLGLGDTASRGDDANEMGNSLPAVDVSTGWNAVSIAAGSRHTCALLIDGSVKCWGNNDFGQLGLGDTDSRGDDVYEMGDYLSPVFLGAGRSSTGITTKGEHSCTLLTDGSVRCWGYNHFGQLGLGDSTQRGDHADELGDNLPSVKLFSDVW